MLQQALTTSHEPLALCDDTGTIRWGNSAFLLSFLGDAGFADASATASCDDSPLLDSSPALGSLGALFDGLPRKGIPHEHGPVELSLSRKDIPEVHFRAIFLPVSAPLASAPLWLLFLRTGEEGSRSAAPRDSSRDRGEATEFMEEVIHDLRNPIGAVFGFADALLETPLGEGLGERQRETVARIRRAAFNANELTLNYQALLRVRSRTFLGTLEVSELNLVARLVEQHLWRGDAETDTLAVVLSPQSLPVAAPRLVLERIISNLLRNALKFTPRGESITLSTTVSGDRAELTVHNTRPVIPKEELEKLSSRYTQGRAQSAPGGLGLGLFIVDQLVTAVGGALRAESSPEKGTAFTVSLPMA